ncbi:MAG: adenosylmethionine decarboxylase [Chloroflexi bacterium]|nr:adenosylmethionine decarboxylase [Chloroflexota bacterium]
MGTYSEERGEHRELLADITVEDPAPLVMVEPLWSAVREAVVQSGASIVDECVHQFHPHGFTGVLLLSQSHVSIHTWVEERLLLLDVQACGDMNEAFIVERLRAYLEPCQYRLHSIGRGQA